MNNSFITKCAAIVIALLTSIASFAQARIDKEVARLEKSKDVEVTYTERRNPNTKKLIKQSIILNGDNKTQAEYLWKAFDEERENSVSVTKNRNSFIIKFEDKQFISSYILKVDGSKWSLVVSKTGVNDKGYSYNDDSGFFNDLTFNDPQLEQLNALSQLDLNNGEVFVGYASDGTILYRKDSKTVKPSNKKVNKTVKSNSKSHSTRTVTKTSHDGKITTVTYDI